MSTSSRIIGGEWGFIYTYTPKSVVARCTSKGPSRNKSGIHGGLTATGSTVDSTTITSTSGWEESPTTLPPNGVPIRGLFVCWSLTSLCHSNGHIETIPAREINPFTALTRIRSQLLRTQWSTSNHSEWTQLRVRPLSHRGWPHPW